MSKQHCVLAGNVHYILTGLADHSKATILNILRPLGNMCLAKLVRMLSNTPYSRG